MRRPGSALPGDSASTSWKRSPLLKPSHNARLAPAEKPPTAMRRESTRQRANARRSARSMKSTSVAPRLQLTPAAAGATMASPGVCQASRKIHKPPFAPPLPAPCSARSSPLGPPPPAEGVTWSSALRPLPGLRSKTPGVHPGAPGLGLASSLAGGSPAMTVRSSPPLHPIAAAARATSADQASLWSNARPSVSTQRAHSRAAAS